MTFKGIASDLPGTDQSQTLAPQTTSVDEKLEIMLNFLYKYIKTVSSLFESKFAMYKLNEMSLRTYSIWGVTLHQFTVNSTFKRYLHRDYNLQSFYKWINR